MGASSTWPFAYLSHDYILTHTTQGQTVTPCSICPKQNKTKPPPPTNAVQRMTRPRLPASSQRSAALPENTTVDYSEVRFRLPDEGNGSLRERLSYQCPAAAAATLKQVERFVWRGGSRLDVAERWRCCRWEELEGPGSKKRAHWGRRRKREVADGGGWGGLHGGVALWGGAAAAVRPPWCLRACT